MADYQESPGAGRGQRPPQRNRKPEVCVPLLILLMIFAWPVGMFYLFYRLFINPEMARGLEEVVGWVESLFQGKPKARRTGGQAAGIGGGQQAGEGARAKKKKEKPPKLSKGILARVLGVILFLVGFPDLREEVYFMFRGYEPIWDYLFHGLVFTLGGALLFYFGQRQANLERRSQRYWLAIGDAEAMELDEIAKRVGRTRKQTIKDLQRLIEKNCLGDDAYLDLELGYFLRFGAQVEPPREPEPEPAQPEQPPESEYTAILRKIRTANDRIDDPVLSEKIDRLEEITRQILRELEAHPEKRERMHTFFDYYLPTTQKLLDTYADFEEAGVEGENLGEAKRRIEGTMDSIVEGFARQLDGLFKADVMDVESDIRVMESMLHRDSASAARDFGMRKEQKK